MTIEELNYTIKECNKMLKQAESMTNAANREIENAKRKYVDSNAKFTKGDNVECRGRKGVVLDSYFLGEGIKYKVAIVDTRGLIIKDLGTYIKESELTKISNE